ncbi:telomerase reverse transcriptase-like [Discoglossus pictus]
MGAGEHFPGLLNVLKSLYEDVCGIVEFVERLQENSKVIHEGDSEKFKIFLSELLVCNSKGAKRLGTSISFLQLSTQREVVSRVIQRICEKKQRNILAFGYGLVDEKSSVRIMFSPNICSNFPNPTTATISTSTLWETLLSRIGDEIMMHLLEHCSLFMFVPPNCCYQISGQPVYNPCYDANISPTWAKPNHPMTRSNVLFQYAQRKTSPLKSWPLVSRWKKDKSITHIQ